MSVSKIKKLAIANRGEVAVRIIHACHELGIKTVLLHSEADVGTRAYRMADEKVCIGPASTSESYLQIERNVRAAVEIGADAVHPGFGFLSENADFAEAVEKASLIFVGPRPETIRLLGDKISAKYLIEKSKVPTVTGYMGDDQKIGPVAGDGRSEILAGSGTGGQLQVVDGLSLARKSSLIPYTTDNLDGIYVG